MPIPVTVPVRIVAPGVTGEQLAAQERQRAREAEIESRVRRSAARGRARSGLGVKRGRTTVLLYGKRADHLEDW